MEYLSITRVSHEKRYTRKSRFKQKVILLLKTYAFGLWFYYFCRKFADSTARGEGGTLLLMTDRLSGINNIASYCNCSTKPPLRERLCQRKAGRITEATVLSNNCRGNRVD